MKHIKYLSALVAMLLITATAMQAQTIRFTLQVDKDTARIGDVVTVTYTLKGGQGDFVTPDFKSLHLVGGPNYSSSMQIINGKIDQENSYSYIFQLVETGEHVIPSAVITLDGERYESPSSTVYVIDNPDWEPRQKKQAVPAKRERNKKRKVTRI